MAQPCVEARRTKDATLRRIESNGSVSKLYSLVVWVSKRKLCLLTHVITGTIDSFSSCFFFLSANRTFWIVLHGLAVPPPPLGGENAIIEKVAKKQIDKQFHETHVVLDDSELL